MGLMNCKAEIAIVYSSITGNTRELTGMLVESVQEQGMNVHVFAPEQFCQADIGCFDAVLVGTYTWGSGEIPYEMRDVYHHMESVASKHLVTAVFGTGDSFFAEFCGAVDGFRDMLYAQTDLAAVLKVELMPQEKDLTRCEKFVEAVGSRLVESEEKRKSKAT
ncbi:flavodoxin domain-containing protein [Planococcus beigongshangi]|uniref:flavodoxin domain-containing protein n=1 Tax=Planococcus beigongshangi TaxID=2782536 RepID=UPI00193BF545|nr:flavodoxin domain-containing protein [Planococcus beigongshangi]